MECRSSNTNCTCLKLQNNHKNTFNKKVTVETLCWFLFGLQIVLMNVMEHTIQYKVVATSFIIIVGIKLFKKGKVKISKYHVITVIFILLNLFIVILGNSDYKIHSIQYILTVTFNLVLLIMIYNYFICINDLYKLLNIYVIATLISSIILIVGYRDTLFLGRLGFTWRGSDNSFFLFGIKFFPPNSNGIASYCSVAFLFSIFLFLKLRKKRQLVFSSVFLVVTLMTGSRKGLILLVFGLFLFLINYYKGNKKILYTMIGVIFCALLYVVTQKIPTLYNIIGSRLNELFDMFLGNEVKDSSISTRKQLIDTAIYYFKERPIMGYGMDAFRVMSPFQGICIDNNYLEIAVSSGIIGFIVYYSFLPMVLYDYFSIRKRNIEIKLLFSIFILCLILEYGSVTYYGRFEGIMFVILYYGLKRAKYKK